MRISNVSSYIKAMVEVEAEGFFVERLINLCKINGVKIWDIAYINSGKIKFFVSTEEFKKLKPYAKKTKCKIKIVNKSGIYFNLFRYRKRRLGIYLAVFVLLMTFLISSFVWKIDIIGNSIVSKDEINLRLEELGVHKGKSKLFISKGKIVDYLRANIYEIAWAGINIKGSTMEIVVEEKIISNEENNKIPGSVIATKDAILTKIIAENGKAMFKTGSYVGKGDILISSTIPSEIVGPTLVHAKGIVKGIIEYEFIKEYKYEETKKEYTGQKRHGIGVGINNKEFVLKYLPNKYKYDINNNAKIFNIFSVNISFIFNTYDEYILNNIVNTKENLIHKGEQDSAIYLENILTKDAKLVEKKVDKLAKEDGIIYKVVFSVEENIGEFVEDRGN